MLHLLSHQDLTFGLQIIIFASRKFFADADAKSEVDAVWEQFYQAPNDGSSSAAAAVAAPVLANRFLPARRKRSDLPACASYSVGEDKWMTAPADFSHLTPAFIQSFYDYRSGSYQPVVPPVDEAAFLSTRHRFHEVLMEITVTINNRSFSPSSAPVFGLSSIGATKLHLVDLNIHGGT
jgi:hypothetical protein